MAFSARGTDRTRAKGGEGGGVKVKPLPVEARLSMSLGALVAR